VIGKASKGAYLRYDFPITGGPSNIEYFFSPDEIGNLSVKKAMRQCHSETSGRVIKILSEFTSAQRARVKQKERERERE